MWFTETGKTDWRAAISHLAATSPRMAGLIKHVGPCTLERRRDYFVVLCKAIFNQQLSMKAAATLFGRFRDLFPSRRPTPDVLLELVRRDAEILRRAGSSRQK